MTKSILAGLLSVSLAISPLAATPAQADNQDLNNILIGIVALTVIGSAIENSQKNQSNDRGGHHPQTRTETLPARCVVETRNRRGVDRVLDAQCASWVMDHPERLPRACIVEAPRQAWQLRGDQRRDHRQGHNSRRPSNYAYDLTCLGRAGFRVGR